MTVRMIKVPDIGEGIAEVELVAWHVKPGDKVAEDQVLAEVMTDKAAVEVPSPLAGQVVSLGGDVGQTLAVGAELIRIEVAGSEVARATSADAAPAPAAPGAVVAPCPPRRHQRWRRSRPPRRRPPSSCSLRPRPRCRSR